MPNDPRDARQILSEALAVFLAPRAVEPASHQQRRRHRKPRVAPPDGLRTAEEAAAKLACSIKTLNGYVEAGTLRYVAIGHGSKRQRKMFTDADLNALIEAQTRKDAPCPSTATHARHSGNSISSGEVIAFTARPKKPTNAKPKR
jgi:hypothetical protein